MQSILQPSALTGVIGFSQAFFIRKPACRAWHHFDSFQYALQARVWVAILWSRRSIGDRMLLQLQCLPLWRGATAACFALAAGRSVIVLIFVPLRLSLLGIGFP